MIDALRRSLTLLSKDSSTARVVITGQGSYFCSGAAFTDFDGSELSEIGLQSPLSLFLTLPKPIIAAVNGPAFGAGVTQATLCDVIYSAEEARFSLPFLRWKVSPEGCSSAHFVRIVGGSVSKRMIVDGWIPSSLDLVGTGTIARRTPAACLLEAALALEIPQRALPTVGSDSEVTNEYEQVDATETAALGDAFSS